MEGQRKFAEVGPVADSTMTNVCATVSPGQPTQPWPRQSKIL